MLKEIPTVLCDKRVGMGWEVGGGREFQEGGDIYIHMLINVDEWQKSTQYCKTVILQLKLHKLFKCSCLPFYFSLTCFCQIFLHS